MPIGRATLEALRLRLQAKQAQVRQAVQMEQDEVLQVGWVLGRLRHARVAAAGGC